MICEMCESFYYKGKIQENKENVASDYFSGEGDFYLIFDRVQPIYMKHSAGLPLLMPVGNIYDENGVIDWEPF